MDSKFLVLLALLPVCLATLRTVHAGNVDAAVDDLDPFTFYVGVTGAAANHNLPYVQTDYSQVGDIDDTGTFGNTVQFGLGKFSAIWGGCGTGGADPTDAPDYYCYFIEADDKAFLSPLTSSNTILYTANYLAKNTFTALNFTLPAAAPSWLPTRVMMRPAPFTVNPGTYKFQFFTYNWKWSASATYFRIRLRLSGHNLGNAAVSYDGKPISGLTAGSAVSSITIDGSANKPTGYRVDYHLQDTFNRGDDTFGNVRLTLDPDVSGSAAVFLNIDIPRAGLASSGWFLYDPEMVSTTVKAASSGSALAPAALLLASLGALL